jgi:hypothetical protein
MREGSRKEGGNRMEDGLKRDSCPIVMMVVREGRLFLAGIPALVEGG